MSAISRPQSHRLFEEALKCIPGGVNSPVRAFRAVGGEPFFVQRAEGAYVYDVDEKDYVDYVCTWGPAILGHAPQSVIDAVTQTAKKGVSFGIPNPFEVEMARKVCEWVPSVEKVRMCNSGTEATMSCVRLARGFTSRDKIIKFEGCYHGHVDALLVKAGSGALTLGFPDSAGIPLSVAEHTITLPLNDIALLEEAMKRYGDQLAGVILEPVPANVGLIMPDIAFLKRLRTLCTEHKIVLIFDEVMTGFRVARGGAQEILGIRPDLSAFGKVIGGGLPVGAFGGNREIMDHLAPLGPVYQAGTLSGNPLAMAAGLAQLKELKEKNGFERLERIGSLMEKAVRELLQQYSLPYPFYRIGSMFCLFFTQDEVRNLTDAKKADTEKFRAFFHHMLDRGVYLAPSQFETGFISLAHGEVELEKTIDAMKRFFAA